MRERAHGLREKLLADVMDRASMTGRAQFMADMRHMIGNAGHISPNSVKAGYILADLNNNLNAAERRILRQFDDQYANVIAYVSSQMATGAVNTRQAVGEALQIFADKGITGFIDRGGHHWTLENYAEMATLTAIERATISGYVDTMQSYGYDLAVIDGHIGSCPIYEAWEGVIVSVSGQDGRYPSLSEAEAAGCFHPRCMHGISTYYEGISHAPNGGFRDEPRPVRDASPQYTARSRQRYAERMARKYRDRAIVAQTPQQKAQAQNKAREWSAEAERQRELQFGARRGNMESGEVRYRKGVPVQPTEKALDMALDKHTYAMAIAQKYNIHLVAGGKPVRIVIDDTQVPPGKTRQGIPNTMFLGPLAFVSEEELANTIAHEVNHNRSFARGGMAPEDPAYAAGNALGAYIRGER
ncbi:MAG: hypothetical protein IKP40_02685 [Clostridia bacterium]|nr:hypothetical protein [Clostridia bacterium]